MATNRLEDAISEVMGHIFMIAGVVILGAVTASFTFGFAAGITQTVAIAVSAYRQGGDIVLTYDGARDLPLMHALDVASTEADGMAINDFFPNTPPAIGGTLTIPTQRIPAATIWSR